MERSDEIEDVVPDDAASVAGVGSFLLAVDDETIADSDGRDTLAGKGLIITSRLYGLRCLAALICRSREPRAFRYDSLERVKDVIFIISVGEPP